VITSSSSPPPFLADSIHSGRPDRYVRRQRTTVECSVSGSISPRADGFPVASPMEYPRFSVPFRFSSARNRSSIYRSSTHTHSCNNRRNDPHMRGPGRSTGTAYVRRRIEIGSEPPSRRRRPWQQNVDTVVRRVRRGGYPCSVRAGHEQEEEGALRVTCRPVGRRGIAVVASLRHEPVAGGGKRRARAVPRHRRAITDAAAARSASANHLITNTHALFVRARFPLETGT
jgi:hypothetical protein